MALRDRNITVALVLVSFLILFLTPNRGQSQIATDGTLGPKTALEGPNFNIGADLGQQDGANLFHSFRTFNIQSGESAAFSGPESVESIISRVTGGERSTINGLLRSEIAGASLFFLNPAGVLFGPDATLEVDGSFHVTTADYLKLGEDGLFSAADPGGSRLASAPPSAFGFLGENPSGVTFLGSGSTLAEERLGYNGIKVPEGETLSVIAGDIGVHTYVLDNGVGLETRLKAPGGRLNLASVRSAGEVVPEEDGLDLSSFGPLGDINITQGSLASVTGEGAGDLYIRGGRLVLNDQDMPQNLEIGGGVYASSLGDGSGGNIGISIDGDLAIHGGASIYNGKSGVGVGGDIIINAGNLLMTDGGEITSIAFGGGKGASIDIAAGDTITLQSNSKIAGRTYADGAGGDMQIEAKNISLRDWSWIDALSHGAGNGGDLSVKALEQIEIQNGSDIMTIAYDEGKGGGLDVVSRNRIDIKSGAKMGSVAYGAGEGGEVVVSASEEICVTGKTAGELAGSASVIGAQTMGSGDAGNLLISVPSLKLGDWGSISSGSYEPGTGRAGDITIETESIKIGSWGGVSSSSSGKGRGGDIQINAVQNIIIDGFDAEERDYASISSSAGGDAEGAGNILIRTAELFIANSGVIDSSTSGKGDAGNVEIEVNDLEMRAGRILSSTAGEGNAGNLKITVKDKIELLHSEETDGSISDDSSISSSTHSVGNAGNIDISVRSLTVEENSVITSLTSSDGNAGNINVNAETIDLYGRITGESGGSGVGGDIDLNLHTLHIGGGGRIVSGSIDAGYGNGGDIHITATDDVRLFGQNENGDPSYILSNAIGTNMDAGDGGDVFIEAGSLSLEDGAMISTMSMGPGNSGDILADVRGNIVLSGNNKADLGSSIVANANDAGDGGNVDIKATGIFLQDGADISTVTRGTGQGGEISIAVSGVIELKGELPKKFEHTIGSVIMASSFGQTPDAGAGGGVVLTTDRLVILDGGSISVTTGGPGKGGTIDVKAKGDIFVGGESSTGLLSMIQGVTIGKEANAGDGGDLTIRAHAIELAGGGTIDSSSSGGGDSGNVIIQAANSIHVHGKSETVHLPSSIQCGTSWKSMDAGDGGDIKVSASAIELSDGGIIESSSNGPGSGGTISVHAKESIKIHGYNDAWNLPSSIRADAGGGGIEAGDGGAISIRAQTIALADRGVITASTEGGGRGGEIVVNADQIDLSDNAVIESQSTGTGAGGDIRLTAADRIDLSDSAVTTQTTASDGGSMDIRAADLIHLKDSQITTSVQGGAGNGGNISIDPQLVILDHSEIIANAHGGAGGNIAIVADQLMADPYSTIEASSELGIDGQIHIDAPVADISGALAVLPGAFLDASALMSDPCDLRTDQDASSLMSTGFGNNHLSPDELFPSMGQDIE